MIFGQLWRGLLLCDLLVMVSSHNYLILSCCGSSHVSYMQGVAEGLVEAGENVTFALASHATQREIEQLKQKNITALIYTSKSKHSTYVLPETSQLLVEANIDKAKMEKSMNNTITFEEQEVWDMMDDKTFQKAVSEGNFDMIIIHGFIMAPDRFILPYVHKIPYVIVTTHFQSWAQRVPALPSFVPVMPLPYSQEMSFLERRTNFALLAVYSAVRFPENLRADNTWARYLPGHPPLSNNALYGQAELILYNRDHLMAYPEPRLPNGVDVGGLTLQPPKKLSEKFLKILDSTELPVVVVSFGSNVAFLPSTTVQKVSDAFKSLDYTFLFRCSNDYSFSPNVKTFQWLPQNDLLAHPKVKLFITHCGNTGQMEALYHGVPMVGVPLFGDQSLNAERIVYNGYGRAFDIHNEPAEKFTKLIREVIMNSSYSENIKKASRIFRDRPDTPRSRAAFWVKHVTKYGSRHLRSYANDMPLYQYWMVDVIAFLSFLLLIGIMSASLCFYCAVKWCGKQMHATKVHKVKTR